MGSFEKTMSEMLATVQGDALSHPLESTNPSMAAAVPNGPILLVESNLSDARHVGTLLKETNPDQVDVTHVGNLQDALRVLQRRYFGVVLLDLDLPDGEGLDSISKVLDTGSGAALVVLSADEDEDLSIRALQAGAQDYLVKAQLNGPTLRRSMRYAIERRRAQARLSQLAQCDQLTGLTNRTYFRRQLSQSMRRAAEEGRSIVLMVLDFDRFNLINDTFGHDLGDTLLRVAAGRLRSCVREAVVLARIDGDEFAVVFDEFEDPRRASEVADAIASSLAVPFTIGGKELYVTTSAGSAVFPQDGDSVNGLLKAATSAQTQSKARGGNGHTFFSAEMNSQSSDRFELASRLRRALERREFVIHYQPKVDTRTSSAMGVEALLRWRSAQDGLVSPVRFIPLLEESGQIVEVGAWLLKTVCERLKAWAEPDLRYMSVAVNVSPRQLRDPKFAQQVTDIVKESGIYPPLLELEITESLLIEDPEASRKALTKLKHLGVRISIDDFGVGYSSLNYLANFPVDTLKIDQSFVREMSEDQNRATIVAGIIQLAHSLGLKVVAEGVETPVQLRLLRDFGCDACQGYLYSRPIPEEALRRWLADQDCWTESTSA